MNAHPSTVPLGGFEIRRQLARAMRTYGILAILIVLVATVSISSDRFLTVDNIGNMMGQWAPAGVIAIGMTLVILTGGFDLSVASGFGLCAVISVALGQHYVPEIAFAAAIGAGLMMGMLNGFLVAGVGVNPFITTVGTGFIFAGIAFVITGTDTFVVSYPGFGTLGTGELLSIPYTGWIMVVGLLLGGLVLSRTVYGQWIYGVGGNLEASRLSGIRVRLVVGSTYAITGLCVGIAGVMAASQLSTAQASLDPNIVFDVLTIVVIGGTALTGGFGGMWRTAVGIALLATLINGMNLLNISVYYQDIVKGVIIVGALALDTIALRLSKLVKEN